MSKSTSENTFDTHFGTPKSCTNAMLIKDSANFNQKIVAVKCKEREAMNILSVIVLNNEQMNHILFSSQKIWNVKRTEVILINEKFDVEERGSDRIRGNF